MQGSYQKPHVRFLTGPMVWAWCQTWDQGREGLEGLFVSVAFFSETHQLPPGRIKEKVRWRDRALG